MVIKMRWKHGQIVKCLYRFIKAPILPRKLKFGIKVTYKIVLNKKTVLTFFGSGNPARPQKLLKFLFFGTFYFGPAKLGRIQNVNFF